MKTFIVILLIFVNLRSENQWALGFGDAWHAYFDVSVGHSLSQCQIVGFRPIAWPVGTVSIAQSVRQTQIEPFSTRGHNSDAFKMCRFRSHLQSLLCVFAGGGQFIILPDPVPLEASKCGWAPNTWSIRVHSNQCIYKLCRSWWHRRRCHVRFQWISIGSLSFHN